MPDDQNAILGMLETERVNPATAALDRMSPPEIVQAMNAADATVADAVARELSCIARAVEEIAARLRQGGRLIYIGAGSSGRMGVLDAVECPPTFNTTPDQVVGWMAGGANTFARAVEGLEDDAEAGRADVARLGVGARDALVGIAASGNIRDALDTGA